MKKYTVCLIGKPNVGKSTLFNRLIKKNVSIVNDIPGITRDRIYGLVKYNNFIFHLIDTGGIDIKSDKWSDEINAQVKVGIMESDVILFVVDAKTGITSSDEYIKDLLYKSGKDIIVVVNKMDNKISQNNSMDFYNLGFDKYVFVSAEHNLGIDELLDKICENFKVTYEEEDNRLKFCVIGRPNVGKSSLVNALLNEERVIVSDIPGTTRDSVDTYFKYEKNDYVLIDTAGFKRVSKVLDNIEKYSLIRSMKSIDRSDVCILVLDAEEGIMEHDKHIVSYVLSSGVSLVIAVNKWDKISNKNIEMKKWKENIKREFKFIPYVDITFLSAKTKKRINTLMPLILKSYNNSIKEVKTSVINDIIIDAYIEVPPPSHKGTKLKIYFTHQSGIKPPKFDIEVNNKSLVHFSYARYLENKIREKIDFTGTPIILQFKNKR